MEKIFTRTTIAIAALATFSFTSVTAQPTITSFTPTSSCSNSSVIVTVNGTGFVGVTDVTFNGMSAASFTVLTSTQLTAQVPVGATSGPIKVIAPSGIGISANYFNIIASVTPTIQVSSLPVAVSGTITICPGTLVTFMATPVNGGPTPSYQWYNSSGAIPGATASTYSSSSLANGETIYCVITCYPDNITYCPSPAIATSNSFTIAYKATPGQPATITGPSTVCACQVGVTYTTTSSSPAADSYTWTVPGGTIVSGQSTNTITVSWGCTPGTYTISVSGINCGTLVGPARTKTVTVNPLVTPPALSIIDAAGGPMTINQYDTINFSGTINENVISKTGVWKVDGVPVTTTGSATNASYFLHPNPGAFSYIFSVCGVHTVSCEITFAGQPAPMQCYSPNVSISNALTYTVTCPTDVIQTDPEEINLFYPNPVTNELGIINSKFNTDIIEIFDLLGNLVLKKQIRIISNQTQYVDISQLPPGIYFVKAFTGTDFRVNKFIKQ